MEEKKTENNKISIANICTIIGTICAVIAIIPIINLIFSKDTTELKILTIEKMQLTKIPEIDGLTANYFYQDSLVNNLWTIRAVIINTGSKPIIGKGTKTNLLSDSLLISISDSVKVLSIAINDKNFPISIIKNKDNTANLDFKQWKYLDAVEIVAIVESFGKTTPFIYIDERDIIDAKVIFSDYKPTEANANKKLIDAFGSFNKVSFMLLYFFIAISLIFCISLFYYKSIKKDNEIHKRPFSKKDYIKLIYTGGFFLLGLLIPVLWFF